MKKQGLIFTLFAVVLLVVLAGCSRSAKSSGRTVEITVQVFSRGTDGGKSDPTNNNWTRWIQEKVLKDENIKVKFVPVPRWEEVQTMNNFIASGTPPDVCVSYSQGMISNFRDLGGLLDLSPYIDTTLKDLKEFLGPDTALPGRDLIRRNEDFTTKKIYSIPARRIITAQRLMFIRKDWLDKLGLPLPSTTEEYHMALRAFKEKDPGGIGKNRVIPLIMSSDIFWFTYNILYSFIDPNLSPRERWINTVEERWLLLPGFKNGMRFLNQLYQEGLIDRDFAVYKGTEMNNPIKGGQAGSFCGEWNTPYREDDALLSDLQKNVPGADIVPFDGITCADGISRKTSYDSAGVNFYIPASCKNPEAALRYVNWLSKFENYNFLQIGPEGVTHDIVDGVPKIKAGPGLWVQNSPQNLDYTIHINGLDLGDPEMNIRALAAGFPWPYEKIRNAWEIAMNNAAPLPVVPVTLSAAGPFSQTLIDKHNALLAQLMICNPRDFDRIWDAGIAEWMTSGARVILEERAAKYINVDASF
jgi:putative aldouronate transport system substrate-binding protein